MSIDNDLGNYRIYKKLTLHLNQIINDENFCSDLSRGKYSMWARFLTVEQLIPMLCAIGEYGRYSPNIEDIPIRQQIGKNLKEELHGCFEWNSQQITALSFLIVLFRNKKLAIENSNFSWKHSDFKKNICWADSLTSSDLFGVIWHVGGFSIRCFTLPNHLNKESVSIDEIPVSNKQRFLEALNCLTRVAQGKQTYYRHGGKGIVPLPEVLTK